MLSSPLDIVSTAVATYEMPLTITTFSVPQARSQPPRIVEQRDADCAAVRLSLPTQFSSYVQ